jgi:hypothetical protein
LKPRVKHSLKELNLASFLELTPRKRKLYEHTRNKDSALCKLEKKYKGKKLKKLCDVDSDISMENLSSSLTLESARFGARGSVVVKALCCKPEGRGFKSQ